MEQTRASLTYFSRRLLAFASLLILLLGAVATPLGARSTAQAQVVSKSNSGCQLGNGIQHVIYLQFDNVHFTRDNPNVPSDLEQMPNLLNFLRDNGVLLTNQHTPLIAHTGNDIVTSLTGLYPDQQGLAVSNSYRYYKPDGTSSSASAFTYWTDPVSTTDTNFNVLDAAGQNTPAPWVPYARAGCNVGGIGTANIELENIGSDINTVYGPNSPQAQEAKNNPNQANADFVGISVHCAKGNSLCSTANTGVADVLPDEPGGYNGYQGLFGNAYVAPQISPNGPVTDLDGNVIKSETGNIGFPGFDGMSASVSLAYVADMQEHGVPVTYAYISDAHDNHSAAGGTFGPGEAGYVAQLKAYNEAFGKFFARLAQDGITSKNTLFVVTSDEGDHFVGSAPSPANCDGVTIPCTYSQVGEVDANLSGLLASEQGITTPFSAHFDSAPAIYINGNPARNDETVTRPFERAVGKLTAVNPYTNATQNLTNYLADPVELNLLHMVTADLARTPTFIQFANPDYFLCTSSASFCPASPPYTGFDTGFAWNHGDVSPDVNTTWLGMVGPDVQHLGVVNDIWSDHTDTRPTMMELLGLKDDYQHEGRVLFEVIQPWALPEAVRDNENALIQLAQAYKQIDAPVGALGLISLQVSTTALESNAPNDQVYTQLENLLTQITQLRNALASQMIAILEAAEFGGNGHSNFHVSILAVNHLVAQAHTLVNQLLKATGKK